MTAVRRCATGFVWCLTAVLLAVVVPPVRADGLVSEIRGGILYHDVPGLWSGFSLETKAPDINAEIIFSPSLPMIWGTLRPAIGITANTGGGTSHIYADARWQRDFGSNWFLGLGVGVATHNGETEVVSPDKKALGGRLLLHFPLEIGFRFDQAQSISLYFEHISNGYTRPSNEGLDRLGLRYGYRF